MKPTPYLITVRGRLSPALAEAFGGLNVTFAPSSTAFRGDLDQAALHGVLERIEALGLELLEVRRINRSR
jgi:hypothetical protein